MTWQLLIWNIFVWTLTASMVYLTNSSLWWLLLPAMLTGTQNTADIIRGLKEKPEEESFELDEETKEKMRLLKEKMRRGDIRRERL